MDGQNNLYQDCISVLKQNDVGGWTKPALHLYPHQWFWDSCFIAIGQRHFDVKRAQKEIKSLLRGQWKNGMIPNMIYGSDTPYSDDIWNSNVSKNAPKHIQTSGITQPPMLAEAIVKIGEVMNKTDRKEWYKSVYDELLAYHEWLYRERDPHSEGLIVLVHPWESGLDNNPGWMNEIHLNEIPGWIRIIQALKLPAVLSILRRRTKYLSADERIDSIDALRLYSIVRRLKRRRYETRLILRGSNVCIEDLSFNSILIRANALLVQIASEIHKDIPGWLWERFKKAPHALELLWNEHHQQYFSRNFNTFEQLEEPSIMTFLPLYAGTITHKRAQELVEMLKTGPWNTRHPIPSVPKDSKHFDPNRYWQGPTWINTNWLIIEGLNRYGFKNEAQQLSTKTIGLVQNHGAYEYFNPLTGLPAGTPNFSWTAALTLDLLNQ